MTEERLGCSVMLPLTRSLLAGGGLGHAGSLSSQKLLSAVYLLFPSQVLRLSFSTSEMSPSALTGSTHLLRPSPSSSSPSPPFLLSIYPRPHSPDFIASTFIPLNLLKPRVLSHSPPISLTICLPVSPSASSSLKCRVFLSIKIKTFAGGPSATLSILTHTGYVLTKPKSHLPLRCCA